MTDLKSYEYVIAIFECGGISSASKKLGIAQPTLSRYIKRLEGELGAELFDRRELPLRLTALGKSYVEAGKKLIYIEGQLEKKILEIKKIKNTVVRVGISPSRSPYLMPKIAEVFVKENPDVRLIIEEKNTTELAERLDGGELDLIISLLDEKTELFEREELFSEELLLAVKRGSCPTQNAKDAIRTLPTISVGQGQTMWHTLHSLIDEVGGVQPKIECQSIESAIALVRRGLGATLVPSYVMNLSDEEDNADIEFLSFSKTKSLPTRKVCLFYKSRELLTRVEGELIRSIKNLFT